MSTATPSTPRSKSATILRSIDKPVIVGGGKRGVVAACCYVARTYGIRSAMPMFEAKRRCPQAVVVKPNMAKYVQGRPRRAPAPCSTLTPLVEPLSIDEAFLDLTGTERLHGMSAAKVLARFAREVERDLGITVSIGLSANKFLAKIASDMDKPRGFAVLGEAEAAAFLAPKPVGFIYGVGARERRQARRRRLSADRRPAARRRSTISCAATARKAPGSGIWRAASTRAPSIRERDTKSISAETTFDRDIGEFRPLEQTLWELTEKVSARLKANALAGSTVTLKLKSADFKIRTRARALGHPTQLAARIFAAGRDLLAP